MQKILNLNSKLTYASLMALALGVYTSMTFVALAHIFMIIPLLSFLPKTEFSSWKKSQWFFLVMIVGIILSVLFNQDIAVKGYAPLTKTKYYLFGLFSILPIQNWYQGLSESERVDKIRKLLFAVFITATFASLYGMGRIFLGLNIFHLSFSDEHRNTGLFGMVLNFAHNLAFIQLLGTFLLFNRDKTKKYIGTPFLIFAWIVNFVSLYTTYSRGALLAFLVAVPFIFFLKNIKKFVYVTLIASALLGISFLVPSLKVVRVTSDLERVSQWKTAIKAFEERPLFGMGYLNFEKVCPALKIKYDIDQKQFCGHAHNIFLEALASSGIFTLIFFVLWIVFWFIEMIKRNDLLGEIMIPLIIVFIVGGMTQATFTLGANLFLIMGLYSLSLVEKANEA